MDATAENRADLLNDEPARVSILGRLWQQRLVIALVFGATLFVVIGVLYCLPVSYVADGSLIVADREPVSGTAGPATTESRTGDVQSGVLLIRSPRLLRLLLARPGARELIATECGAFARQIVSRFRPIDCAQLAGDPEAQLRWVQSRFSASQVGQSRVITVGYRSPNPNVAQAMVNALLQQFLEDERAKMRRSHDEAIVWVRQTLSQVDAELQRDAAKLDAFREQHGLMPTTTNPLAAERLTQASQQLAEAEAAQAEAEQRFQQVRTGRVTRQAADTRAIADLRQQLTQASALGASAAQRYGSQNPMLLAYRRQEADIAGRLAAETSRVSETARRDLDAAKSRVENATRELNSRLQAAKEASAAATKAGAMQHELDVKRSSSLDLTQRLGQLETERRVLEPGVELMNLAELPVRPSFPRRTPFLLSGLSVATVLAFGAGLLTYRPRPSGPLALGRTYTRIPILAQVPEMRLRRTGKKEVAGRKREFPLAAALSLLDTYPPLLEAIRILHARLVLGGFGGRLRTLLIASEMAGEGKSFITMALARMANASGRRVLVIETSLREPCLGDAMHAPETNGLAGYLRGGPVELVHLDAMPGVDFLLAGSRMPDSTELLSGPRFRDLLDSTRGYDLVLIDSAPVSDLMDGALLAPVVDGVVFCLRAGRPPVSQALNTLPDIQRSNGNVVGLALTFVPDRRTGRPGVAHTRQVQARRELQPGHA
ncbi:MAG: hypothetical protein RQ966_05225 [Acetobacteraceae bacterium]|nr:hypothetical protein [Acetobacteraceae bacterium]